MTLTSEEFEQLIQRREGETLDFKKEMPRSSDLAKLVTAFYNTQGGVIVFGVEDDTRRPVGVANPQGIEEGVVNILRARCSLDVMPSIECITHQGMEFVVVTCPQGGRKPYLVTGETRPYVRVGSSNRQAQDEEVRRLYVEGSEGGFEALPCRQATLADLSPARIAAYVRRREETSGRALGLEGEEVLRSLGCLVEQKGGWVPTNAGVLLFAEDPQHFIGQAEVACVRFKGTDVVTYLDRRDLHGPLYQLVDDAEQFIYRHMKIGRRIEGFVGVEYREYPAEAVREAIVNAVVHRDYSRRGQRIRIFMFDDRIEVYSPGTLPPGVSLEKMRRLEPQSVLRNDHRRGIPRPGRALHRAIGDGRAPHCPGHGGSRSAPPSLRPGWKRVPGNFDRAGGALYGGKEGTSLLGKGAERSPGGGDVVRGRTRANHQPGVPRAWHGESRDSPSRAVRSGWKRLDQKARRGKRNSLCAGRLIGL